MCQCVLGWEGAWGWQCALEWGGHAPNFLDGGIAPPCSLPPVPAPMIDDPHRSEDPPMKGIKLFIYSFLLIFKH
jgi:hypothetical protein